MLILIKLVHTVFEKSFEPADTDFFTVGFYIDIVIDVVRHLLAFKGKVVFPVQEAEKEHSEKKKNDTSDGE